MNVDPTRANSAFDVQTYFPLCPPPVPTHEEQARRILDYCLPEAGELELVDLSVLSRPDLLSAIWRSHKAKFVREGRFERAFRAQLVLDAIRRAPPGSLAVARMLADGVPFIAWIDLVRGSVVSLLEDDESYLPSGLASTPAA